MNRRIFARLFFLTDLTQAKVGVLYCWHTRGEDGECKQFLYRKEAKDLYRLTTKDCVHHAQFAEPPIIFLDESSEFTEEQIRKLIK